ncbi:hypothetical protein P3S67_004493 [Capsicum chacoense]
MDIEALFMNSFSIEKKPSDICKLIERAVVVAKLKYPAQLEKCKNRLIMMMLNTSRFDCDDEEEEEEDETSNLDEEESTNAEQKEEHEEEETQQITHTSLTLMYAIRMVFRSLGSPTVNLHEFKYVV